MDDQNKKELWNAFIQSGKVKDYLRYCDYQAGITPPETLGKDPYGAYDTNGKRPDHPGEQRG